MSDCAIPLVSLQVEDRCFVKGRVQVLSTPWRAEYISEDGQKVTFVLDCLQIHGVRRVMKEDGSVDGAVDDRIVYCQFAEVGAVIGLEVAAYKDDAEIDADDPEMFFVEVEFRLQDEEKASNLFGALASALSIIDDDLKEQSESEEENEDPRLAQLPVTLNPAQFEDSH